MSSRSREQQADEGLCCLLSGLLMCPVMLGLSAPPAEGWVQGLYWVLAAFSAAYAVYGAVQLIRLAGSREPGMTGSSGADTERSVS